MNFKKRIITSAVLMSGVLSFGIAQANTITESEKAAFLESFGKEHPELVVDEVSKTEIPNILEIIVDKTNVFYADETGKYVFYGHIIKNENGSPISLTEKRVEELSKFDLEKLNYDNAVITKKGNGENKIVTFEDPNCGFCQKLHGELAKLDNVTISTFIIPILGPSSVEVSKQIWCSDDKSFAWNNYMEKRELKHIDTQSCDVSALEDNVNFATSHNISGTPAIFFENGKNIKGYVDARTLKNTMLIPKK